MPKSFSYYPRKAILSKENLRATFWAKLGEKKSYVSLRHEEKRCCSMTFGGMRTKCNVMTRNNKRKTVFYSKTLLSGPPTISRLAILPGRAPYCSGRGVRSWADPSRWGQTRGFLGADWAGSEDMGRHMSNCQVKLIHLLVRTQPCLRPTTKALDNKHGLIQKHCYKP